MDSLGIILISLDEEQYIGNVLQDIANQTGTTKSAEVIISDGGSKDNTELVVRTFQQTLPLNFHKAKRRGYGLQKNEGVAYSHGTFLVFMDADIRIGPSTLDTLAKSLLAHPNKIITTFIAADTPKLYLRVGAYIVDVYFRLLTMLGRPAASGQCIAMSRVVYETVGGFDDQLLHGEDLDFLQRAHKKGIGIWHTKRVRVWASTRRFEEVGTMRLLLRYARSELHRLSNHGKIEHDHIGYDKT